MAWNFQREESNFAVIPEGRHRIRINSVEKVTAKTGREMLSFKFDVSGYTSMLFHNIVFLEDRPEITNRQITQFFDAFPGIAFGDLNLANWVGKVGACQVKHEEYNGEDRARVSYFVKPEKAENLPPWKEPERKSNNNNSPAAAPVQTDENGFIKVDGNSDLEELF